MTSGEEEGGLLPVWAMNTNRKIYVKIEVCAYACTEVSIHISFLYSTEVAGRKRLVYAGSESNCVVLKVTDISIYSFIVWYSMDSMVQQFSPDCNLCKSCYECVRVVFH